MLYRTICSYRAEGTEKIESDFGVKLHGALMNMIPREIAEEYHRSVYLPFSICCVKKENVITAKICALTDSARIVCDTFANSEELEIFGMETPLVRIFSSENPPMTTAKIERDFPDKVRVKFVTPAAIKQNKIISCTPSIERYFRTTAEKYAFFENNENLYEKFRLSLSRIRINSFSLNSTEFNLGGNVLPGFTGYMDLNLRNEPVLRKIISYAQYSGIGAKTAMGMGGIEIEKI